MSFTSRAMLLLFAGAGACAHHLAPPDSDRADAGVDAGPAMPLDCDDPAVWAADAPLVEARVSLGSGPCAPPGYPIRSVSFCVRDSVSSCWRVTEADPRSGWAVGDVISSEHLGVSLHLRGHQWPVTFEARVADATGRVVGIVPPTPVMLEAEEAFYEFENEIVGVASAGAFATRHHDPAGEPLAADEENLGLSGGRGATRLWARRSGRVMVTSAGEILDLGPADEVLIADHGMAAVFDQRELVMVVSDVEGFRVARRVSLPGDALEVVSSSYYDFALVHVAGALLRYSSSEEFPDARLVVGEGRLLAGAETSETIESPVWWDGRVYQEVGTREELALIGSGTTLSREDADTIGLPLTATFGTIIGEHGFALRHGESPAGPTSVSAEALYGPGRIALVGTERAHFVYLHDDGTSTLRQVDDNRYCGP